MQSIENSRANQYRDRIVMITLYTLWQDTQTRLWHPVGLLRRVNDRYMFVYTKGAELAAFIPFQGMPDIYSKYESATLFPLFANRVLPKTRPEFKHLARWSGLDVNSHSIELEMLSITAGQRETDNIRLIARPELSADGFYYLTFFVHGMRYLDEKSLEVLKTLKRGSELSLLFETDNAYDQYAIAVENQDTPPCKLGYVPRYYAQDLRKALHDIDPEKRTVRVKKINHDAPLQLRLMCEIEVCLPKGHAPLVSDEYIPLYKPGVKPQVQPANKPPQKHAATRKKPTEPVPH